MRWKAEIKKKTGEFFKLLCKFTQTYLSNIRLAENQCRGGEECCPS